MLWPWPPEAGTTVQLCLWYFGISSGKCGQPNLNLEGPNLKITQGTLMAYLEQLLFLIYLQKALKNTYYGLSVSASTLG